MLYFILVPALFMSVEAGLLDNQQQILASFKDKYNNSQSDLIFLLDVSGSVSNYGFKSEKIFVENLLNEFSVAPYSTRVVVITFGKVVKTDINYIDIDPSDKLKNKCEFKPFFEHRINHRYGWRTDMAAAFQRAMDVLQTALNKGRKRRNVHTVTMMITDGYWNPGDPRGQANRLKSQYNNELFMVGVDGYSRWQLQALASTRAHVLEFNSFKRFRDLAMHIRGDAHDRIYMEVPNKCTQSSGCDGKAFCACGTVSGIYQCVCREGHYGPGTPGHCYKCIRGTYKQFPSPEHCKPCPAHSTTSGEGSTSIRDCTCFQGYEGDPTRKSPCVPVRCGALVAPRNGRLVAPCNDVYSSVCQFQCSVGYNLKGSRSRTCQKTRQWSGVQARCEIVQCTALPLLTHGTKTCTGPGNGRHYGDICTYSCDVGYVLKGSPRRVCLKDGSWSGNSANCQAKLCPALRRLAFGTVEPVDCVTHPQPYGRGCVMRCVSGYDIDGDSPLTCGASGQWNGRFPTCKDNRPPVITCPASIDGFTDPERPTKRVTWNLPNVQDNAELHDPNAVPTLRSSHPHVKSPYDFALGTKRIVYTATDKSGHSASCTFTVTVKDNEPPLIYCPANMELQKRKDSTNVQVFWKKPQYFDNSNGKVIIFTESKNGSNFVVGSHTISYTATDPSMNKGKCSFIVVVSSLACKPYDPPINGLITCESRPAWGGDYCTPQCNSKFDFSRIPAYFYPCNFNGHWQPFDYRPNVDLRMPWPDCTESFNPNAAKGMEWQYFTGDCSSPATQKQAKENFVQGIKTIIGGGDPNFCEREQACKLENIRVVCGKTQPGRKRSTGYSNVLKIDFELDVMSKGKPYSQVKLLMDKYVAMLKAEQRKSLRTLNVPGLNNQFMSMIEQNVVPLCQNGSVYEMNKLKPGTCQSCPNGNYYDSRQAKCVQCVRDTYQDQIGSLKCKPCPRATYTFKDGAKKGSECKLACQAGSYSTTGLVNCIPCPISYYQPDKRQSSCRRCPGSTVTLETGAKSISQCGMPCAPGTYSKTGVEPCTPCPMGTYQAQRKQSECTQCSDPKSTYGTGSVQLSQCVVVNYCGSNPCNNGGRCSNKAEGYECQCAAGYTGKHCEIEEDECTSSPCAQGATCVDKVNGYVCQCPSGYTGRHCDTKTVECKAGLCHNIGKCVDTPSGFECICPDGYDGQFCETNINECKSKPCQNGAKCTDKVDGFQCTCAAGFLGERCEEKTNGCRHDSCLNGAACQETSYGHKCACANGYKGLRCEIEVNECAISPCLNNGYCVDQKNGFKCLCKPGFSGATCGTVGSSDFDLLFERARGRGMSTLDMRQELRSFTVSFWMKSGGDDIDPGTPISYAVQIGDTILDNALVIHDYSGFNLWINNEKAPTTVPANDGKWHHMAFTWQSSTGHWKVYKDGANVRSSSAPFQKNKVIAAGGLFVLGQEQDTLGGNFSANEAFMGHMSQMNIWSYELDVVEISEMARHAEHRRGNVVAWSDFLIKLDSNVRKIQPSNGRRQNKCWSQWIDRNNPNQNGDQESATPGACAGSASFDCQTLTGDGLEDVELNATCTSSGVTCLNSEQSKGTCPDFKFRAVCVCPANRACSANPCRNGGRCAGLPLGYTCECPAGFEGKICEKAINCPTPGPMPNGGVSFSRSAISGAYIPGTVATFLCNNGFYRSGSSRLTCRSGRWQGSIPVCKDVDECKQNKCQHSCANFDGGYKCTCVKGYALQPGGTCTDINECSVNNGNCQHSCHNTANSYRCSCRSGFRLLADGHACQDINECSPNQGLGPCQQICANSLASYSCKCRSGFVRNGDGKTCREVSCPRLSVPSSGKRVPSHDLTTLGSTVRFECNDGYKLVGSDTRTCQSDGQWTGVRATCAVVQCIPPHAPMYGALQKTGLSYGSSVTYRCNNGYRLIGPSRRTCSKDGLWTGAQPRCIAADCSDPSSPADGKVVGLQRSAGDTIRYECNTGYRLHGLSYSVCQRNSGWSNPMPSCLIIDCGQPPALANGRIAGSVYKFGSKIQYSCNKDFHLSGPKERQCQGNGLWSDKHPECLERSCGNPGDLVNGIKSGHDYTYGNVVTFKCNVGYIISGSASRTCQTTGKWTGTQPTCNAVSCGNPGIPTHGEISGSTFTYGKTLKFDCLPGFKLIGTRERLCRADGRWTGTQPRCDASSCGASMNGPSGRIASMNFPNSYSDNAYCRWKISVRSDRKVMITFNSFQTQAGKDNVEVYDGVSGDLITTLSGIYAKPFSLTSNSNVMDIRFSSDGKDTSSGFEATYTQVSCGGVVTQLESVIRSPNYPNNYPNDVTCAWEINLGHPFQIEFDSFHTETGYDYLQGFNSLSSFSSSNKLFEFEDEWFKIQPVQSKTGQMLLKFKSNAYNSFKGFQLRVKKYKVLVGKKRRSALMH